MAKDRTPQSMSVEYNRLSTSSNCVNVFNIAFDCEETISNTNCESLPSGEARKHYVLNICDPKVKTKSKYWMNTTTTAGVDSDTEQNAAGDQKNYYVPTIIHRCQTAKPNPTEPTNHTPKKFSQRTKLLLLALAFAFMGVLFYFLWVDNVNEYFILKNFKQSMTPIVRPNKELSGWEKVEKFGRNVVKMFQNLAKHLFLQ
jgi:hypothetical protein